MKLKICHLNSPKNIICLLVFVLITGQIHAQEPVPRPNDNSNWISTISYDLQGNTVAKGVSFFNRLGKPTQSQSFDVLTSSIWVSQSLYDYHGRPAFQSLSAPVTSSFGYYASFIKNNLGNTYSLLDFDTTLSRENPAPVNSEAGTLGWYYSNGNTNEPYQDITSYPFSKSVFSSLNPGQVLRTVGGNKVNKDGTDQWVHSYSFTMPAGFELTGPLAFNDAAYQLVQTTKTVSRDVHGNEVVVFTDTDGNTLAAARSGGATNITRGIDIGQQGFVDIHVPAGATTGMWIQKPANINIEIYDLITEETVTPATSYPNGFYRVSIINMEDYNPQTDAIRVNYQENYYDYSLNIYDKANRLIESRQPLNHLASTFTYNTLGQLLETTSPDEGNASFVYRDDGQIRFSQNSKQSARSEFSYTNYDKLGRPIESGVYKGPEGFNGSAQEVPILWWDQVDTESTGPNSAKVIGKTTWDAGLATYKEITGDGGVRWNVTAANESMAIGLSATNLDHTPQTIHYAIYINNDGTFTANENGTQVHSGGTYTSGDEFRVFRTQTSVSFEHNGTVFYTSVTPSSGNLLGDMAFYTGTSAITNFVLEGTTATPTLNPYITSADTQVSGNIITSIAPAGVHYTALASTTEKLDGDGSVTMTVLQTDKRIMFGLASNTASAGYTRSKIKFPIYINDVGSFTVFDEFRTHGNTPYNAGDTFTVERIGTTVNYYHNGIQFYTSALSSVNEELMGVAHIYDPGGQVQDLTLSGTPNKRYRDYTNVLTYQGSIWKIGPQSSYGGIGSKNFIAGNGYIETTLQDYRTFFMGLSEVNASSYHTTIDYALYVYRGSSLYVYEKGTRIATLLYYGLKPGDVIKVERDFGVIKYYLNGELKHTSQSTLDTPNNNPLLLDITMNDPIGSIHNVHMYEYIPGQGTISSTEELNPDYCYERTMTVYDIPDKIGLHEALNRDGIDISHYPTQTYVAGNVSKTYNENNHSAASWYSYDIYGRVVWHVQYVEGLGVKTLDYQYDDATGNVTKVIYQKHDPTEIFVHRYSYNAANQLVKVETSVDDTNFTEQASYTYYENGALKRTQLAQNLQGIDYVYNLNGQLKMINHPKSGSSFDPGGDSNDVFGMILDYHKGDYQRSGTQIEELETFIGNTVTVADQYNGNIRATRTRNFQGANENEVFVQQYTYNNNNWLEKAQFIPNGSVLSDQHLKVDGLSYDANGNLLSLNRNRQDALVNGSPVATPMDQFTYHYYPNTNRLSHITDAVAGAAVADLESQANENYHYNSIGQLSENDQEEAKYYYNASGLTSSVEQDPNVTNPETVKFIYNDRGQRQRKLHIVDDATTTNTWYVRDASGNPVAIYSATEATPEYDVEIYLNAGTTANVTYKGKTFEGDGNYPGYYNSTYTFTNTSASSDPLFQTERVSQNDGETLRYTIPVPEGTYTLRTYHNELWFGEHGSAPPGGEGNRVFDIVVEDQIVQNDLDFYSDINNDPRILSFSNITVTDGIMTIDMPVSANRASVCGIAILGHKFEKPPLQLYLNTGTSNDVVYNGKTYTGDLLSGYYSNHMPFENTTASTEALFQTERVSEADGEPLYYNIPVSNGTYTLTTHHNELWFGKDPDAPAAAAGNRVFDIEVEGQLVKNDFDIFVEANNQEISFTFTDIQVTDGELNIVMTPIAPDKNRPTISGMAIIEQTEGSTASVTPQLVEHPVYGASRLGIYNRPGAGTSFEITDHLGNVRAVVQNSSGLDIVGQSDYYPGGMLMPGHNLQGDYRYNYQGQELDTETGKIAFQLRLYDQRINRWLTPDPKGAGFSPYWSMDNDPINLIDPDGGCPKCPDPSGYSEGSTYTATDGQTYTHLGDFGWSSTPEVNVFGVSMETQNYWAGINALAENLNKQKDLETGKSVSIRMLEELEKEAQIPELIQREPINYASSGALEYIGTGGLSLLKFVKNPNALKHIFRNAPGHVNPTTVTSQNRYLKLFSSVASDTKNLVQTTNAAKINANVKTFHRTFKSGKQVWVETINGKIVNAGVNNIPR